MHNLLSLANTESHNFTSEVLLRQASGSWDLAEVRRRATLWLGEQGLPLQGLRLADGSGLDRANRLTSRLLAALLLRMDHHPYGRQYLASMAVAESAAPCAACTEAHPCRGVSWARPAPSVACVRSAVCCRPLTGRAM